MKNLPISVWSGYFMDLDVPELIDAYEEAGITHAEFSVEHLRAALHRVHTGSSLKTLETEGDEIAKIAEAKGFSFPQGHLEFHYDLLLPKTREVLKEQILVFQHIGVKNMVLHATGDPDDSPEGYDREDELVAALNDLLPLVRGTDSVLCLENLGSSRYVSTSAKIHTLIDRTDAPECFGICLDTGHLNLNAVHGYFVESQAHFIENAGTRLRALHIASNMGANDDHLLPYNGKQKAAPNWVSFMRALNQSPYTGLFNFEIPGESVIPLPVRKMKLRYVKELAEYMQSEDIFFR